jgi:molecular chaperone DnaK
MKDVTLTDEEKSKVEEACVAVEEAIKGNDKDAITQKLSDLATASQVVMQAKAKQEEPKAETAQDPNVVDAEFTEAK